MNRIRNSWPYAVGVLGMFVILWAAHVASHLCGDDGVCLGMTGFDWKGFFLGLMFGVFPTIAFAGSALLGFRRGYDWVTMLICLALWAAIPEPLFDGTAIGFSWSNKIAPFLVIYAIILNLGVTTGMLLRALVRYLAGRSAPVAIVAPDLSADHPASR